MPSLRESPGQAPSPADWRDLQRKWLLLDGLSRQEARSFQANEEQRGEDREKRRKRSDGE